MYALVEQFFCLKLVLLLVVWRNLCLRSVVVGEVVGLGTRLGFPKTVRVWKRGTSNGREKSLVGLVCNSLERSLELFDRDR